MIGGFGVVGLALGIERSAQADRPPAAHEAGGRGDALGRHVVERTPLVVGAPPPPVGDPLEELSELVRRNLVSRPRRHAAVTPTGNEASGRPSVSPLANSSSSRTLAQIRSGPRPHRSARPAGLPSTRDDLRLPGSSTSRTFFRFQPNKAPASSSTVSGSSVFSPRCRP